MEEQNKEPESQEASNLGQKINNQIEEKFQDVEPVRSFKKIWIIGGFIFGIIFLVFVASYYYLAPERITTATKSCAQEGEIIGSCAGCVTQCCGKLKGMFNLIYGDKCTNITPVGGGGICSDCGNGVCEKENKEDYCNCPKDCQKSTNNNNITCTETELTKTVDINSEHDDPKDYADIKLRSGYFEITQEKKEMGAINEIRCMDEEVIFKYNIEDNNKIVFKKEIAFANADCDMGPVSSRAEIYNVDYVKTTCIWDDPVDIVFQEKDVLENKIVNNETVFSKPDMFCDQIDNEIFKEKCFRAVVFSALNNNRFLDDRVDIAPYPYVDHEDKKYLIDISSDDYEIILLFGDYIKNIFLKKTNNNLKRKSEIDFYKEDDSYHFITAFDDSRSDITDLFYFYFKMLDFRDREVVVDFSPLVEKIYSFNTFPEGDNYLVENESEYEKLDEYLKENIKHDTSWPEDEYIEKIIDREPFNEVWDFFGKYYSTYRGGATFHLYLKPNEVEKVEEYINENWKKDGLLNNVSSENLGLKKDCYIHHDSDPCCSNIKVYYDIDDLVRDRNIMWDLDLDSCSDIKCPPPAPLPKEVYENCYDLIGGIDEFKKDLWDGLGVSTMEKINSLNYCSTRDDCKFESFAGSYGCGRLGNYINKNSEVDGVYDNLNILDEFNRVCDKFEKEVGDIDCIDNRCEQKKGKILFNELDMTINDEDRKCEVKNDCMFFQPDCGDCKIDSINKDSFDRYKLAKKDYCKNMLPYVMCDMTIPNLEPACVKGMCEMVTGLLNMMIEEIKYPEDGKGINMKLNIKNENITLLSDVKMVNSYPNYFPGKYDIIAREITEGGDVLGMYGIEDPRVVQAEIGYTGPSFLESSDFIITIPYFENADKVEIFFKGDLIKTIYLKNIIN
jgi:hypothetical protein